MKISITNEQTRGSSVKSLKWPKEETRLEGAILYIVRFGIIVDTKLQYEVLGYEATIVSCNTL